MRGGVRCHLRDVEARGARVGRRCRLPHFAVGQNCDTPGPECDTICDYFGRKCDDIRPGVLYDKTCFVDDFPATGPWRVFDYPEQTEHYQSLVGPLGANGRAAHDPAWN